MEIAITRETIIPNRLQKSVHGTTEISTWVKVESFEAGRLQILTECILVQFFKTGFWL